MLEGGADMDWQECRVLDLSLSGVGIEIFGAVPDEGHDTEVVVDLQPTANETAGIQLRGHVKYTTSGSEGGLQVGIEFATPTTLEQHLLTLLLETQGA